MQAISRTTHLFIFNFRLMKRFLKQVCLFCAVIIAIVLSLNTFQKRFNNEPPHYRLQYIETTNTQNQFNGVIIGSSQATHGIRPSILDSTHVDYYNLALNGSSPKFYLKWIDNLFKEYHPKIDCWIVSTDPYFFSGDGWRNFEQDSEFFPLKDFYKMLFKKTLNQESLVSNKLPLIKYRKRILNSFESNQGIWDFNINDYDKGYITLNRTDSVDLNLTRKSKRIITDDVKAKYVELIDSLSAIGGEIIIIIPPEYNLSPGNYIYQKDFLELLSKKRGISLYDFNDEVYKEKLQVAENFVDFNHLSGKGSKLFSSILMEVLNTRTRSN